MQKEDLLSALLALLSKKNLTVASAESCTGGLVATMLTELPGSSRIYLGGISCYANSAKINLLKVPAELITSKGAVSKEVACSMAENARTLLSADFAIAITGIAGPDGGSEAKPVGTVWSALSSHAGTKATLLQLKGDRNQIRTQAAIVSLQHLLTTLQNV